ncbi:hypothetical protein EMPS_02007 [Entomortierella parvispora]|uniref:Wax synthase domain-containing protein n=1 Tax=Entomortierella parvispora TaxID=205924 RepID=A0A9P3H3Y5_9FUNG|nr:hypothetical protein EMPS_02007 [Entomortierella parvispora]
MEVLTASTTRLLSTLNQYTNNAFFNALPQKLPVEPCLLLQNKNAFQFGLTDAYYFSIFFIFGGGLYILLLLPFNLQQKQAMAAPLVLGLTVFPLITSSINSPLLQLVHMGACGCVLMRMIDLYYVRPWRTGKEPTMNLEDWWREVWEPFRKIPLSKEQLQRLELEQQQSRLRMELERNAAHKVEQKNKELENEKNEDAITKTTATITTAANDTHSITTNTSTTTSSTTATTASKPIAMKGKPVKQIYTPPMDPNPQHWSVYLPRWLFYAALVDVIVFCMSFIDFAQIQTFSTLGQLPVRIGVAAMVIFDISLANYTLMIIWANVTGEKIRNTEWTLVTHYFPGLATSPRVFWQQWHHLFQYIWVDLGAKPTYHFLHKYVTPKTKNKAMAKTAERILPVMGVFLMSGLMHEYMMIGMWQIRPGHMTAFFLIQGAGTIVSQILDSTIGRKVRVPDVILIAMTWIFNLTTASLFMEPVLKNQGHNLIANQSLLVHSYNFLRSNGVF